MVMIGWLQRENSKNELKSAVNSRLKSDPMMDIDFSDIISFCPARRKPKETKVWQIEIVIRCCYLEWNKSLEICIILTWTTGLSVTKSCFTGTIYSTWTTTNICLSSNGSMPPLDTNATLFWAFGPTTKLGPLTISRCWWSTICAWCTVVFWVGCWCKNCIWKKSFRVSLYFDDIHKMYSTYKKC